MKVKRSSVASFPKDAGVKEKVASKAVAQPQSHSSICVGGEKREMDCSTACDQAECLSVCLSLQRYFNVPDEIC